MKFMYMYSCSLQGTKKKMKSQGKIPKSVGLAVRKSRKARATPYNMFYNISNN